MINGVAFNKTYAAVRSSRSHRRRSRRQRVRRDQSWYAWSTPALHMHVPSIVGSQVAGQTGRDKSHRYRLRGHRRRRQSCCPVVPKVKSEVFMAAGKVYDVMINGQSTSGTTISPYANALAMYDRELSLSANTTSNVTPACWPTSASMAHCPLRGTAAARWSAVAQSGYVRPCRQGRLSQSPIQSKGVIANDQRLWRDASGAANKRNSDAQSERYVRVLSDRERATSDSFTYCANGSVTGGDLLVRYHPRR